MLHNKCFQALVTFQEFPFWIWIIPLPEIAVKFLQISSLDIFLSATASHQGVTVKSNCRVFKKRIGVFKSSWEKTLHFFFLLPATFPHTWTSLGFLQDLFLARTHIRVIERNKAIPTLMSRYNAREKISPYFLPKEVNLTWKVSCFTMQEEQSLTFSNSQYMIIIIQDSLLYFPLFFSFILSQPWIYYNW